jgi:hypothetical protein
LVLSPSSTWEVDAGLAIGRAAVVPFQLSESGSTTIRLYGTAIRLFILDFRLALECHSKYYFSLRMVVAT